MAGMSAAGRVTPFHPARVNAADAPSVTLTE